MNRSKSSLSSRQAKIFGLPNEEMIMILSVPIVFIDSQTGSKMIIDLDENSNIVLNNMGQYQQSLINRNARQFQKSSIQKKSHSSSDQSTQTSQNSMNADQHYEHVARQKNLSQSSGTKTGKRQKKNKRKRNRRRRNASRYADSDRAREFEYQPQYGIMQANRSGNVVHSQRSAYQNRYGYMPNYTRGRNLIWQTRRPGWRTNRAIVRRNIPYLISDPSCWNPKNFLLNIQVPNRIPEQNPGGYSPWNMCQVCQKEAPNDYPLPDMDTERDYYHRRSRVTQRAEVSSNHFFGTKSANRLNRKPSVRRGKK